METKVSHFKGHWCAITRMKCPGSNDPAAGKKGWCAAWLETTSYDEKGNAVSHESSCALQKIPDMIATLDVKVVRTSKLANQSRNLAETAPDRLIAAVEERRRLAG